MSDSLQLHELQQARLPWLSLSSGVFSNSCPLSRWCHPTISFSVTRFSSCPPSFPALRSFPASGSFPMSRLFTSGGQSVGASASTSVLPINIQGEFPLGLTGLIFLLTKWLSGVFSSTTLQKHQFFGPQPSLWSNYHICTWLLVKTIALVAKTGMWFSAFSSIALDHSCIGCMKHSMSHGCTLQKQSLFLGGWCF